MILILTKSDLRKNRRKSKTEPDKIDWQDFNLSQTFVTKPDSVWYTDSERLVCLKSSEHSGGDMKLGLVARQTLKLFKDMIG